MDTENNPLCTRFMPQRHPSSSNERAKCIKIHHVVYWGSSIPISAITQAALLFGSIYLHSFSGSILRAGKQLLVGAKDGEAGCNDLFYSSMEVNGAAF
eukprot:scaffold1160_cov120-Skeletonema_menzelii.AAC.4